MTLPERFFCSTQAVEGRAIHMGLPFTSKRTSTASAWRGAMATMLPFQRQCRASPLQRSVTWKSSYMQIAYRPGLRNSKAHGADISVVGQIERAIPRGLKPEPFKLPSTQIAHHGQVAPTYVRAEARTLQTTQYPDCKPRSEIRPALERSEL